MNKETLYFVQRVQYSTVLYCTVSRECEYKYEV